MYAAGGMGFMAFVGWGLGRIQNAFGRNQEEDAFTTAEGIRTQGGSAGNPSQNITTTELVGSDPGFTMAKAASEAGAFNTLATTTLNGIAYAPGVQASSQ